MDVEGNFGLTLVLVAVAIIGVTGSACTSPLLRVEWSTLSANQKTQYVAAIKALADRPQNPSGVLADAATISLKDFTNFHARASPWAHGSAEFYPYHRAMVYVFEQAMQTAGWSGGVVYWDWPAINTNWWTSDVLSSTYFGSPTSSDPNNCVIDGVLLPGWTRISSYAPGMHTTAVTQCLGRCSDVGSATTAPPDINARYSALTYAAFRGDSIDDNDESPVTPLATKLLAEEAPVALHHALVDKVWWRWQQRCPAFMYDYDGPLTNNDPIDLTSSDVATMTQDVDTLGITVGQLLNPEGDLLCFTYTTSAGDLSMPSVTCPAFTGVPAAAADSSDNNTSNSTGSTNSTDASGSSSTGAVTVTLADVWMNKLLDDLIISPHSFGSASTNSTIAVFGRRDEKKDSTSYSSANKIVDDSQTHYEISGGANGTLLITFLQRTNKTLTIPAGQKLRYIYRSYAEAYDYEGGKKIIIRYYIDTPLKPYVPALGAPTNVTAGDPCYQMYPNPTTDRLENHMKDQWIVLRLDSASLGSQSSIAEVAELARLIAAAALSLARGNRQKIVRNCSVECNGEFDSEESPTQLIAEMQRQLVQLVRRSVRDAQLGEDAEVAVCDALDRVKEFLNAIQGINAKLISTNNIVDSNHSTHSMDDTFFAQVVENLSKTLVQTNIISNEKSNSVDDSIVAVFSGSFGPLPHFLSFRIHLPNRGHTSVFAALVVRALINSNYNNISSAALIFLHTQIAGIRTIDPRIASPNTSHHIHAVSVQAASKICALSGDDTEAALSRTALDIALYGSGSCDDLGNSNRVAPLVYIARIADVVSAAVSSNWSILEVTEKFGTRIIGQGQLNSDCGDGSNGLQNMVIFRKRVALIRVDRVLERGGGSSTSDDNLNSNHMQHQEKKRRKKDFARQQQQQQQQGPELNETYKVLAFVFAVLDEFGVQVYLSSSNYKAVTVAVADDDTDGQRRKTRQRIWNEKSSNLKLAVEKLKCLKSVNVTVHQAKGIVSLITAGVDAGFDNKSNRNTGLIDKLLGALGGARIHFEMCSQGVGSEGASVVVAEDAVNDAVRAVHKAIVFK
ncbi:hypothetical protein HK100_008046 [Physocladia obscura]|uniref:Tyrosinase copper-binding domain-containing protein n=1 Tax=Physocladia obscura TaxID=109957 RepID=A0AAD5XII3_9FUNG|nr:hypothetical protein HK100_008046 [Physocladia obscura]